MPKYSTNGDCSFKFELPSELRAKFMRYARDTNKGNASALLRTMVVDFCDAWEERRDEKTCEHKHVKCLDCWESAADIAAAKAST